MTEARTSAPAAPQSRRAAVAPSLPLLRWVPPGGVAPWRVWANMLAALRGVAPVGATYSKLPPAAATNHDEHTFFLNFKKGWWYQYMKYNVDASFPNTLRLTEIRRRRCDRRRRLRRCCSPLRCGGGCCAPKLRAELSAASAASAAPLRSAALTAAVAAGAAAHRFS